jgi:hypothetical protein
MKRNLVMTWALVVGSLPLVGCGPTSTEGGDAPSNTDLAKIAIENTEHALIGAHSAGSFIADSQTFADALSSLGGEPARRRTASANRRASRKRCALKRK